MFFKFPRFLLLQPATKANKFIAIYITIDGAKLVARTNSLFSGCLATTCCINGSSFKFPHLLKKLKTKRREN